MEDRRAEHRAVIGAFLRYLNTVSSGYVLKGGTALMECYGLDRFSEDVDLDGEGDDILGIISAFAEENGCSYRIARNTDTVKRCFVHYGGEKPLKIETSYGKKHISDDETCKINGIRVYDIDTMTMMKCQAYMQRDKIRDLYDLTYICEHYYDDLTDTVKRLMQNTVQYKGLEQFDYLVSDQRDDLIDVDRLADAFLMMYDRLGLMYDERSLWELPGGSAPDTPDGR